MKFWCATEKVNWIRILNDRFLVIGFDNSPHLVEIDFCEVSLGPEIVKKNVEAAYESIKKSVIDSR